MAEMGAPDLSVRVTVKDLALLPFAEQVALVHSANVLIGE